MGPRARAAIILGVGVVIVAGLLILDSSGNSETVDETAVENAPDPSTEDDGKAAEPTGVEPEPEPVPDLPDRGPHFELREISGWLQSDVESLEELRGQVVAVQFWTFGCRNCRNTLPHMQALYEKYHDQGFEIVGIHSPEFDREAVEENVVAAAADLGVTWPIALDPTKTTFHYWQEGPRGFWPRIYLLDCEGNVRYDHHGEGRYDEIDAAVGALLAEA